MGEAHGAEVHGGGAHAGDPHAGDAHGGDAHGESHLPVYRRTILTLAVFTAIEFGIAYMMHHGIPFGVGVVLLVGLAAWKAVLVARFFMHLKYDPRVLALLVITPVILGTPIVLIVSYDLMHGPNL